MDNLNQNQMVFLYEQIEITGFSKEIHYPTKIKIDATQDRLLNLKKFFDIIVAYMITMPTSRFPYEISTALKIHSANVINLFRSNDDLRKYEERQAFCEHQEKIRIYYQGAFKKNKCEITREQLPKLLEIYGLLYQLDTTWEKNFFSWLMCFDHYIFQGLEIIWHQENIINYANTIDTFNCLKINSASPLNNQKRFYDAIFAYITYRKINETNDLNTHNFLIKLKETIFSDDFKHLLSQNTFLLRENTQRDFAKANYSKISIYYNKVLLSPQDFIWLVETYGLLGYNAHICWHESPTLIKHLKILKDATLSTSKNKSINNPIEYPCPVHSFFMHYENHSYLTTEQNNNASTNINHNNFTQTI